MAKHTWCACGRALLSVHQDRVGEQCEYCQEEEKQKKLQEDINKCHKEALLINDGY